MFNEVCHLLVCSMINNTVVAIWSVQDFFPDYFSVVYLGYLSAMSMMLKQNILLEPESGIFPRQLLQSRSPPFETASLGTTLLF